MTTGVATLYGRFETQLHGPAPNNASKSTVSASPATTRTSGVVRDLALQDGYQLAIDLEREHRASALPQREREGTEPGSDLQHPVAGVDPGEAHDAAGRVGIGEEVLPAPA